MRAIRRQPVQREPPRLPLVLTLSNDPGGVQRGVVQNHHTRLLLSLGFLSQGVQLAHKLPAVARPFEHPILQLLVALTFHT